jgi:hypothetical protein
MGWKTKQVKKTKPVSKLNGQGQWVTTYEEYWADESVWVSDSSSSTSDYSSGSSNSSSSYDSGGSSYSGGDGY